MYVVTLWMSVKILRRSEGWNFKKEEKEKRVVKVAKGESARNKGGGG